MLSAAAAPRRRVDGVLLLDKPTGLSSNAALQRARRLYRAEKAGHTGTLDPLASGLLPLCFGEATKFAQSLLDARKEYVATVRFGIATSTGDAEGEMIAEQPVSFTRAELEAALPRFTGRILQVPPRHAALKLGGRAYYDYARAGVEIPRVAREVDIGALELVDWSPPQATLRVECGKGTYIRVLAEDLGVALGSCAHLAGAAPDRVRRVCTCGCRDAGGAGDAGRRGSRRATAPGRCAARRNAPPRTIGGRGPGALAGARRRGRHARGEPLSGLSRRSFHRRRRRR